MPSLTQTLAERLAAYGISADADTAPEFRPVSAARALAERMGTKSDALHLERNLATHWY